ncbi:GTP-binding protein [Fibrobacter intestinalis]|uniref:Elongation factor G n=1 Tax=Fibrobacter intestinalis TaxID=28122 RepID=A0A1T4QW04_9BACT|nr:MULTISPECIES: GTP-binding protein [Fibrobacter]PBC74582.1 elongation factor G [Fibrobacter sp. NR9]SKA07498.1 elongation factor G [Fibrobacter intestinalis]
MRPIRNIAILAHVDAGKTTLSERILFTAGEVRLPGNVEDGLATMDYLPEERKRGITIESGIAHFEWRGIWFNFIDTPGHVDFGAEVDMALSAVDGAVLVISAIDGVETQTLSAWKKLRERGIRTLIFINKLDSSSASLDDTLIAIEEHFGVRPVLLSCPEFSSDSNERGILAEWDVVSGMRLVLQNGKEEPQKIAASDFAQKALRKMFAEAAEAASEYDDEILSLALDGKSVPPKMLVRGLECLCANDKYVLCYAGSAKQNFGVRSLMAGLSFFLQSSPAFGKKRLGEVVRLRHFTDLGEIALFRCMANVRAGKIPEGLEFFRLKAAQLFPVQELFAGDIYALRSPKRLSLGMRLSLSGEPMDLENRAGQENYHSLLQTRLECLRSEDFTLVESSLELLVRMDPSIRIVPRPDVGCWLLYTVGEVQLEVILERLKREFGCDVRAGNPDVLWQERLNDSLSPVENSFCAGPFSVKLSLAAKRLPETSTEVSLAGSALKGLSPDVLAGLRSAISECASIGVLGKGALVGVEFLIDDFSAVENTPVPMIKKACADAVEKLVRPADICLYEPYMELSLECPAEYAGLLGGDILSREGKIVSVGGNGVMHTFTAELPLRKLFGYATAVRSGCKGRAEYSMRLLEYRRAK